MNNYAIEEEILIKFGKSGVIGKHEGEPVFNPRKAIRLKCLSCTCNQMKEIEICKIKSCTLWPWRMGSKPKALRKGRPGNLHPVKANNP